MNSKSDAALAKLDAIEAEMRRIGYWATDPPDLRAAQAEAFRQPIEAMLETSRQDPAEAEKRWQSGREWRPEAHAEREKAQLLFRLIESKAKLQRP